MHVKEDYILTINYDYYSEQSQWFYQCNIIIASV